MLYDWEAEREIYLVFKTENYFGSNFLEDGFCHVFAIERQALGWVCIDPSRSDCLSTILPAGYVDDVISPLKAQNPQFKVLKLLYKPSYNRYNNYPRLNLMSCVSMMQYMLGVYWPWIVTPYQLYCKLLKGRFKHIKAEII